MMNTSQVTKERQRLRASEEALVASFNARDATAIAEHYHPDGLQVLPVHPLVHGRSAIRSLFEGMMHEGRYVHELASLGMEISASCDYAASYGTARVSGWDHPHIPGRVGYPGSFVTVYRKGAGGDWEVIIDTLTPVAVTREPAAERRNLPLDTTEQLDASGQFRFGPVRTYDWYPRTSSPEAEEDRKQIRRLHERADANIDVRNVADFSGFYAEDGLLITPGQPVAAGRAAIQELMGKALGFYSGHQIRYHGTVVSRARDFAFTFGEVAMISDLSGFPANFVIVYRKSVSGVWQIRLDISSPVVLWPDLLHEH